MSANSLFLKSGYTRASLGNGLGRFILQCQRITIKFCKNHGDSRGARDFIEQDLINFARENPSVVTYLKPRRHRSPVLVAEYLNGHREWLSIARFEREEIRKWIEILKTEGGQGEMRYKQYQQTDSPTIQGVWTPFTHKALDKNITVFPKEELAIPSHTKKSATEILSEMYTSPSNPPSRTATE